MSWVRYQQVLLRLVRRQDVLKELAVAEHRVSRGSDEAVRHRAARTFR